LRYVLVHVGDGALGRTVPASALPALLASLPSGASASREGDDLLVDLGPPGQG
jgi:hypothetical protein